MIKQEILLASNSPRRHQLVKEMDLIVKIIQQEVDESYPADLDLKQVAEFIAIKKLKAFDKSLLDNQILVTADTIVLSDEKILGKPKTLAEAKAMIKSLAGKSHKVITGVAIKKNLKTISFSDTSEVVISELDEEEIEYYLEKYLPLDKAGAYGIQEWFGHNFVKSILGSYTNIMGLPTEKLYVALKKF